MDIITIPFEKVCKEYQKDILAGYVYGCECGESYMTAEAAMNCRKCRIYLEETPTKIYYTPKPGGC